MHLTLEVIQEWKFSGCIESQKKEREKESLLHNFEIIFLIEEKDVAWHHLTAYVECLDPNKNKPKTDSKGC